MKENKCFTQSDMDRSYNAGLNNKTPHDNPSVGTLKIIGELNTKIEVTCKAMEDLKEAVDKGFSDIKEAIKELSETKANKWVEKVLIGAGASIGISFLGLLGWLIIEAIKRFQ
jgi:hypothetical protein